MTNFKEGISREQYIMFPEIIDEYIEAENPVRFIDAFVANLDLLQLGFSKAIPKARGTSAYNPQDLLKLYIYGYLNQVRSSRKLEKETHRNVELMWLLKKLKPDFKTIADFRKDNLKGIKNACREFTFVCKKLDLIGGELIAIDGSKFKANNSNKNYYTEKDVKKEQDYINNKINDYLKELDLADEQEYGQKKLTAEELKDKIEKLKSRKNKYEHIKSKMGTEKQLALTDPDSRLVKDKKQYVVGYNVQSAVDAKHNLIVANDVIQCANDLSQLSPMTEKALEIIETNDLKVVADTGYYHEEEIIKVTDKGVIPYVFKPKGNPNDKKGLFTRNDFTYDKEKDVYHCPANQQLRFRGFGKNKKRLLRHYYTPACKACSLRPKCTEDKSGRRICRSVKEDILELMAQRMKQEPQLAILRKQIVEHPFGTLKRSFGYERFLLKGLEKVKAEISLSVLAYNLKRVINIIGFKGLMKAFS